MEKWKKIPESNYSISTRGRVRNDIRNNILKPHLNRYGYHNIHIVVSSNEKYLLIHRLVMLAFVPNPENKPQVNHINGIKNDNRIENLEWCTSSENIIHSFRFLGRKNTLTGNSWRGMYANLKNIPPPVPVYRIDQLGNRVLFNSLKEAGLSIGTGAGHIYQCVHKKKNNGLPYTAKGHTFELA